MELEQATHRNRTNRVQLLIMIFEVLKHNNLIILLLLIDPKRKTIWFFNVVFIIVGTNSSFLIRFITYGWWLETRSTQQKGGVWQVLRVSFAQSGQDQTKEWRFPKTQWPRCWRLSQIIDPHTKQIYISKSKMIFRRRSAVWRSYSTN